MGRGAGPPPGSSRWGRDSALRPAYAERQPPTGFTPVEAVTLHSRRCLGSHPRRGVQNQRSTGVNPVVATNSQQPHDFRYTFRWNGTYDFSYNEKKTRPARPGGPHCVRPTLRGTGNGRKRYEKKTRSAVLRNSHSRSPALTKSSRFCTRSIDALYVCSPCT